MLVKERQRLGPVVAGALLVAVPFVLFYLESYKRFLPPYYSGNRLGAEANFALLETAAMYVVSPSRGLLIYDPIVILAGIGVWLLVRRRAFTALHVAICAIVVGQFLTVAWYGGTGGSSYGPRLMIDILPYVVYLAAPAIDAMLNASGLRSRPRSPCSSARACS